MHSKKNIFLYAKLNIFTKREPFSNFFFLKKKKSYKKQLNLNVMKDEKKIKTYDDRDSRIDEIQRNRSKMTPTYRRI